MNKKINMELKSMNDELYSEFTVTELEQRLETDPLLLADIMLALICSGGYCSSSYSGGTCGGTYCASSFAE